MWMFRAFKLKNNDLNHFHRYQCVLNVFPTCIVRSQCKEKKKLYVVQFIYQIRVEVHSTSTSYMSGKR